MRILDVGCGINKLAGSIGIDRNPNTRADVLVDVDHIPYPFRDSSFDKLQAVHVIEHVSDVIRTMEGMAPPGSSQSRGVHRDAALYRLQLLLRSHDKWHLNTFSLRYFGDDNAGFALTMLKARFQELSVRVKLLAFWRWLGFEWAVNHSKRFRRFWEHYLCYVVRGKVIEWRLKAVK